MISIIEDKTICKQIGKRVYAKVNDVKIDPEMKEVFFNLDRFTCVDMNKSIEVAKEYLPDVKYVYVVRDNKKFDHCYYLKHNLIEKDVWKVVGPCFPNLPM